MLTASQTHLISKIVDLFLLYISSILLLPIWGRVVKQLCGCHRTLMV